MEASIPLAQDQAFAESLSFDTAYRYSDYDTASTTDTYKFGMEWAPVEDIRFRASFQRAVRAANIVELFTAQGFNLFDTTAIPAALQAPDPDATTRSASRPACRRATASVRLSAARQPGWSVQLPAGRRPGR